MADIFPSLVLGLLPRLGYEPSVAEGFRGWLLSGKYSPEKPTESSITTLEITDESSLTRHVAFDFERFSLSSRESRSIAYFEKQNRNVASWPLLKLYYSAFFAAHALMRSQGCGVVKVEKRQIDYLNSILQMTNPSYIPNSAGMYIYKTIKLSQRTQLAVTLEPIPQSAGVHEGFWKIFCQFLNDTAENAVIEGAANGAEFISGVDELTTAIKDGGANSGVWYSNVRNEINYQHKHGAWFPLKKNALSLKALRENKINSSKLISLNNPKDDDPLNAFANLSLYLALLNFELSEFVAARSTSGNAFGSKWRRITEQL